MNLCEEKKKERKNLKRKSGDRNEYDEFGIQNKMRNSSICIHSIRFGVSMAIIADLKRI